MLHITPCQLWAIRKKKNNFKTIWTRLNQFEQFQTSLDNFVKSRIMWTRLDQFKQASGKLGPFWTILDKFGQVWTSLDKFGQVWTSLKKNLNQYGQVRTSLEPIKNQFEQFHTCFEKSRIFLIIKSRQVQTKWKESKTYLASKANAKTPAASGAAAEVPEWVLVHFPYRSVVA